MLYKFGDIPNHPVFPMTRIYEIKPFVNTRNRKNQDGGGFLRSGLEKSKKIYAKPLTKCYK